MLKNIKYLVLILAILSVMLNCSNNKQQQTYTVGIININKNLDRVISEFKKGMAQYGYNEGANITYLYSGALKSSKQIDQEVLDMLDANVDLLFTLTTPVTKKAKALTEGSKLPILFSPIFSPVTSGIVDSIAKPGKNVTGISTSGSTGKALEWYLKTVPSANRIFVPFHNTDKAAIQTLKELKVAAKFFNIELIIKSLDSDEELNKVLSEINNDIDAIWLTHSHLIISNTKKIVTLATAQKKPVISSADQSEKGVMLCYAASHNKIGKQASRMAEKLLNGVPPTAMPVEIADFFLGLNLKTAKAIGIKIPDDIISQADFITR